MGHLYDNIVALQKMEQAIRDLGELNGDSAPQLQKLIQFLREAVDECREFGRVYDQQRVRQLSRV